MTHIALIIINVIISISGIFIVVMYFKSKLFHSYPYYFNIFFILTILLNNLIRLIPKRDEENEFEISLQCYIQGISLTVLDKLMLCQITSYSVIYYLGSFHLNFFEKYQMLIFLFLSEIGFIISLVLATVFSIPGMSVNSQYCYIRTNDINKFIIDTIVTSILWLISLYCTIRLLISLIKIKREMTINSIKAESIQNHTFRFGFNLIFNIAIFLYVILIINKKLNNIENFAKDMFYILLSLIGEIFFTVNMEVIKEAKRIIKCQPPPVTQNDVNKSLDVGPEEMEEKKPNKEME